MSPEVLPLLDDEVIDIRDENQQDQLDILYIHTILGHKMQVDSLRDSTFRWNLTTRALNCVVVHTLSMMGLNI